MIYKANPYVISCYLSFFMLVLLFNLDAHASCNDGFSCSVANCNTAQLQITNNTSDSVIQINNVDYTSDGVFTVSEGCCSDNNWPGTWSPSDYNIEPGQSLTVWGHEVGGDINSQIYVTIYKNDDGNPTQTTTTTLEVKASDMFNCLWANSVQSQSSTQYYTINKSSDNGSYSGAVATFTINNTD